MYDSDQIIKRRQFKDGLRWIKEKKSNFYASV